MKLQTWGIELNTSPMNPKRDGKHQKSGVHKMIFSTRQSRRHKMGIPLRALQDSGTIGHQNGRGFSEKKHASAAIWGLLASIRRKIVM
jgi:hypothetical protein